MSIKIIGTGSCVPEKVLTNQELEKMVETSDEWIIARTGIKERRIADQHTATSDLAERAARRALDMAGIKPEQLDLISLATATPDMMFPSTACILQRKLGAANAACYDLAAACTGLVYSLEVSHSLLKASPGKYRYALVTGAEKFSSVVDWTDRTTCILFGDGAAALILENNPDDDGPDLIAGSKISSDGTYGDLLYLRAGNSPSPPSGQHPNTIRMNGREIFRLSIACIVDSCKEVMAAAAVTPDRLAWFVPHQANMRIIAAVAQRLKVPKKCVYANIEKYGNTSAASIGICLDELCRAGKCRAGDYILITAFGGGLTWGSMLLRW